MEENSNLKQNIPVISLIAIMAIFLVNRGVNIVTPAMNTFYEHFSDFSRETVAMISTLPNLTLVIGTLVVGAVVGKRFSFKTMAILGSVIYLIGGVAPYFIDDLYVILGCRLLFGFGLGLIYPLSNALINGLYEGDKRATYLGYGTFMLNLGGIALQTLGGILADIDWQLVFLAHAVSLLALVCAFLLPEPPKKEAAAKTGGIWLTAPVAVIGVVFFVYMLMAYPAMLNISVIFSDRLGSGAAVASTALSLYTALAAVSGFFFGMIFKKLKRWCLFLGFAIATIGILTFISQWNSFIWPLMVSKDDAHRVMAIGLLHFRDAVSSQVNLQMAGATIVLLPMLLFYLAFHKQIIEGVSRGGIKG